jgi:hypothetical protein
VRTLVASELLSYLENHSLEIENIAVIGGSSQDYEVAQNIKNSPFGEISLFWDRKPAQ